MSLEVIIACLALLGGCVAFIYKAWVELKIYSKPVGNNNGSDANGPDIIKKRNTYYFVGGIIALVILIALVIFFVVHLCGYIIFSPETTPSDSESPTSTESQSTTSIDVQSLPDVSKPIFADRSYNGATYCGYINATTDSPDGKGKMIYPNGNIYDGEWSNGIQEGQGTMEYYNGDTYVGTWKNGKKNGPGVYTWNDGKIYDGLYKNDKREGEGVFTGWTGYVSTYGWAGNYYGSNKDDTFEGYGRFEFDNGDNFVGVFNANQFWNGVYTKKNGREYDIVNGETIE